MESESFSKRENKRTKKRIKLVERNARSKRGEYATKYVCKKKSELWKGNNKRSKSKSIRM